MTLWKYNSLPYFEKQVQKMQTRLQQSFYKIKTTLV